MDTLTRAEKELLLKVLAATQIGGKRQEIMKTVTALDAIEEKIRNSLAADGPATPAGRGRPRRKKKPA